jgi:hypothetical protein
MMVGVNSTMMNCKHLCKSHNVLPVQKQYDNGKRKKLVSMH